MSEPRTVFVLQTWIPQRTIEGEGCWLWDLSDLFASQHEAETTRAEFFADEKTRIVRMVLGSDEIVGEFEPSTETFREALAVVGQKTLF